MALTHLYDYRHGHRIKDLVNQGNKGTLGHHWDHSHKDYHGHHSFYENLHRQEHSGNNKHQRQHNHQGHNILQTVIKYVKELRDTTEITTKEDIVLTTGTRLTP